MSPGTIPATPGCESAPVVGFISHVDTSPDMKGSDIRPGIIERYDGGDIALNDKLTMRAADFPELAFYKGHRLIVTDGTTLLGADDKAGHRRNHDRSRIPDDPPRSETRHDRSGSRRTKRSAAEWISST